MIVRLTPTKKQKGRLMKEKVAFDNWFKKFQPEIEELYEDFKQREEGTPSLDYFEFAFGLYTETAHFDNLKNN